MESNTKSCYNVNVCFLDFNLCLNLLYFLAKEKKKKKKESFIFSEIKLLVVLVSVPVCIMLIFQIG
jgi:heme O synthase-like polyprenyltransferase